MDDLRWKTASQDTVLLAIAKKHCANVTTLERRNSDEKDFPSIAVWELKAALKAAYEAGAKSVKDDKD